MSVSSCGRISASVPIRWCLSRIGRKRPEPVSSTAVLLLLALEARDEPLLGPLRGLQVVLEDPAEELHQFLVALLLGVLDEGLQRLGVVRRLVEHRDKVVV